jgi:DNA-binding PadR family transcriptional regulator
VSIDHIGNSRLSPEFVILGFLYKGPSHGYDLHQRIVEEFSNVWHTSQSQTYNILKRLEAKGFVTATLMEQDKLPAKQVLQLTDNGIKRFETWLKSPTKCSVHAIRVEFITRLYFMRMYFPNHVGGMIETQVEVVQAGIKQLQNDASSENETHLFDRLAIDLRINLLQSVAEWLNASPKLWGAIPIIMRKDD